MRRARRDWNSDSPKSRRYAALGSLHTRLRAGAACGLCCCPTSHTDKKSTPVWGCFFLLVREAGLEPARP